MRNDCDITNIVVRHTFSILAQDLPRKLTDASSPIYFPDSRSHMFGDIRFQYHGSPGPAGRARAGTGGGTPRPAARASEKQQSTCASALASQETFRRRPCGATGNSAATIVGDGDGRHGQQDITSWRRTYSRHVISRSPG